ncbi:MAG: outer membrane protein assembly factor BamA [Micavibrio aeruginosavorus]|uniref:Outer membrane protein assembly factor BamA n=1 Tax=Micavibrio aeruginosavorus TaxID=349221 RepID=A0A2W5MVY0_9BACT|nr:MAG: outer membrane protein assembly factor BamA [Micavibrio aeruginosavorus]
MSRPYFFITLFLACVLSVSAWAADTLREIRIDGAQRIEAATVLSYLNLQTGQPLTDDVINEGLKNLFATGLFADVKMTQQNGVLMVNVVENPIINEIAFEGNKKIEDNELLAEISLRPRQVYTKTKVQNDVSRIYQLYQRGGRFAVDIEPKIIELDQNRVNLVFEITEGDVTAVQSIRFVGNKAFDDDQLRAELSTKEEHWYRFFASDDRYDEDRVKFDEELLRRFYLKNGYADFRVVSSNAELSEDKENFYLTFTVEEGQRYKVNSIGIESNLRGFDATPLKQEITFLPGQWYDADAVQISADKMSDKLGDQQYAFADVDPKIKRNSAEGSVDITFDVAESPRVFVERIDIHGNLRTIDKVIRREMLLVEGDPFSKSKLARSEQRIRDLDYFETVNIKTLPGSAPDKTVIDIEVAEQSTGELSVGAGFSTQDGPLADLRIRERNLLGKGQDLTFATTLAGKRTEFDASFTEPYFLDRDLSAGVDAFHITRDLQDESSFDQRRTGGALRMGYPLSEKWRQGWKYRFEQNEIDNVDDDASRFIKDQEGERITSAVSQRLSYDDRDSTLFPADGLYSWLDLEGAGLGGDAKYVSGDIGSSYYIPFYDKKVIFNIMGETGAIKGIQDEDVKINERYMLGGNNFRGFEKGGIGPRDTDTDDALGGNLYYRGTAELTFPIGLPEDMGVAGHAFTDFGSLWDIDETGPEVADDSSLRATAGLGISWRSPMGPVRVNLALPYLKEDYDQEEFFSFSFGTRF